MKVSGKTLTTAPHEVINITRMIKEQHHLGWPEKAEDILL